MFKKILVVVSIAFFLFSSELFAARKKAGKVKVVAGGAFTDGTSKSRNIRRGTTIYVGETIVTGKGSRVKIKMIDDAVITLGEKTEFLVKAYNYQKNSKKGSGFFSLVRGVFRAVSGKLAKLNGKPFKLESSGATIGVKGTDFWGGYWENGNYDIALLGGTAITVSTDKGSVTLDKVGWGTTLTPGGKVLTAPKKWPQAKLEKAANTVNFPIAKARKSKAKK